MRGEGFAACACAPDLELDTLRRQPHAVKQFAAANAAAEVGEIGWLDFVVPGAGWTVQICGVDVDISNGFMLPAPPSGLLNISNAGPGTLKVLVWPEEIGRILAMGRGAGTGAASGGGNPKTAATASTDDGKITAAAVGTQVTGTILLAAGASRNCIVEISGDGSNTLGIFVSRTQAGAAAFTGMPVYGAGQDQWFIPQGGKLWVASSGGAQIVYARETA